MKGKVVYITGGGSGVGRATAICCAKAGVDVVIVGGGPVEKLESVIREVEQFGVTAGIVQIDVANADSVADAFKKIRDEYGRLDVLVNCAGVCSTTPFNEITLDEWNYILDINLTGSFLCCQQAIEMMAAQGEGGAIINVSSIAGKVGGLAVGAHYAASKAGVIGLTMAAARFAARHGIRVNAVAPGPLENEMTSDWDDETKARLSGNTPLGALGSSEDAAEAIMFLASAKARHITGEILDVNGGLHMD